MKQLLFAEQRDGQLKDSISEVVAGAIQVSGNLDDVACVVVGDDIGSAVEKLKSTGIKKIFSVKGASAALYNPLVYVDSVDKVIDEFKPDTILAAATPMGRDIFARVAARRKAAILTDLVALEVEGGSLSGGTKPMYAGKVLAQVRFSAASSLKIALLRPNVFTGHQGAAAAAEVVELAAADANPNCTTVEIRAGKTEQADLTEAKIIVSGGRSLGSQDNFAILNELAGVLGATVGASRAAVDAGYAAHDMQVGQTGKTVNPQLYIACGISGAIQHLAGMRTSKVIVAINTDPDAPLMKVADYAVVGDLFEIVPAMTKHLKEN